MSKTLYLAPLLEQSSVNKNAWGRMWFSGETNTTFILTMILPVGPVLDALSENICNTSSPEAILASITLSGMSHVWLRKDLLHGWLFKVQSNQDAPGWREAYLIKNTIGGILLHSNTIRIEECRCNLTTYHEHNFSWSSTKDGGMLCWRHCSQESQQKQPPRWPKNRVQHHAGSPAEDEPDQVIFESVEW